MSEERCELIGGGDSVAAEDGDGKLSFMSLDARILRTKKAETSLRRLISAFLIRVLERIIHTLAKGKISNF